jgi:hypothetical protein
MSLLVVSMAADKKPISAEPQVVPEKMTDEIGVKAMWSRG